MARPRKITPPAPGGPEDLLDAPAELVLEGKEASAYQRYLDAAKDLQAKEQAFQAAQGTYRQALIDLNNAAVPPPKAG